MTGWRPLAGGNIHRFGQAEGEAAAFFEPNLRHFTLPLPTWGGARVPAHEQTGRLNRQICTGEVDRIERQSDITTITPDVGGLGGLHTTRNGRAAWNQLIALDHHGVIDDRVEPGIRAGIVG